MTSSDPTLRGFWRPLGRLQAALEQEITAIYADHGIGEVRPRFAYPLIRLAYAGPMTIRELAESLEHTHSAVSQTIAAMRQENLVDTTAGPDARTRVVDLTERGRKLVPFLEAEWRATEDAIAALDAELPFRLSDYVDAVYARLAERRFADRITDRLTLRPQDSG